MKFKVEPKDFLLFCIYCGLLLYLCAIAILNLTSLLNDGVFYGLLPFKAFTLPYLPVTLLVFLGVLGIVFSSVSSYIFSKDKGFGIGLKIKEKSNDGYSKWAKEKEITSQDGVERVDPLADKVNAAGVPLINNGKEIWVDNGEYHNLVIGSTGSGKTVTIVKPMVNLLAKKGESMIITDPKGEIYKYSCNYLKQNGYRIILLNFREPQNGNAWNPLTLPYRYYKDGNVDKATELLDDVALNILYDPTNKSDSDFWEKSAADYFSGLALGLFMDASEKQVNLNSINLMSNMGEERYATSNYIKEYFNLKGEDSSPYIFASNTINAPNDTKGGILSTFRQKIRKFSTQENLSEMLSYSDFDMRDLGKSKTAVFMIIHDEKKTYHSLMTIFIKQCYETLIDVAQECGGKLPYRTNFILDEFANMPPLKDVDSMVSAARSRDIRFTFIIQNFAQLNDVYGNEVAEVIKGNCGNLIYLISTELKALEEISKMCGEVKSGENDKTASTPLITVSDLQKLKLFEAIIIRLRTNPFRTKLEPDFKMNWGITREEAMYPTREKQKIETFNLKKFVTDENSKKMANSGMNMGMPGFGMGSGMSPFGPPRGNMPPSFGNMNSGLNQSPFKPNANPFMGNGMPDNNPFKPSTPFSPFAPPVGKDEKNMGGSSDINKPFNSPMMSSMDIDAMLKDLDEKFKELDRQEEEEKKKLAQKSSLKDSLNDDVRFSDMPILEEKKEEKVVEPEEKKEKEIEDKPEEKAKQEVEVKPKEKTKINVDADSVIVNENVISDDEFFDDFFSDDD